jgi:hypothetical protein
MLLAPGSSRFFAMGIHGRNAALSSNDSQFQRKSSHYPAYHGILFLRFPALAVMQDVCIVHSELGNGDY